MHLEDPELSGGYSLLFLIRNCKENAPGGSGAPGRRFPYCFFIRNCKENEPGGS
jgi:hypothetical protein